MSPNCSIPRVLVDDVVDRDDERDEERGVFVVVGGEIEGVGRAEHIPGACEFAPRFAYHLAVAGDGHIALGEQPESAVDGVLVLVAEQHEFALQKVELLLEAGDLGLVAVVDVAAVHEEADHLVADDVEQVALRVVDLLLPPQRESAFDLEGGSAAYIVHRRMSAKRPKLVLDEQCAH